MSSRACSISQSLLTESVRNRPRRERRCHQKPPSAMRAAPRAQTPKRRRGSGRGSSIEDSPTLFITAHVKSTLFGTVPVSSADESARQQTPVLHTLSSKAQWVGLALGAGAGFGLGPLAGFQWFDDSRFAERKIGTTVVMFTVSGGVGGYLIGRSFGRKPSSKP